MSLSSIPQMRTITEAIKELKELDSSTGFTEYALRTAINQGQIPYIKAGNKILINMENLVNYLNGVSSPPANYETTKIRRVT